jgi:hypothetical protein
VDGDESEVGWAKTWQGKTVAGVVHVRVTSQRDTAPSNFHRTRLVPQTHGMPCTISVQRARLRSSHVCSSGVLSEDEVREEAERETAGGYVGSRGQLYRSLGRAGRKYLSHGSE